MSALKAEIERLNAENARFRSGELVTLQEKVTDTSFTSLKKELDDHVKGIHSRMDKFDKNQELCMTKLDNLEQTLAQVVQHLKINPSTSQSTPEDPSTKGEKDKEDEEDKDDHNNADAADRSNKDGDADKSDKGGDGASGRDSSAADRSYDKSKDKMPESENIFTNQDYGNIPEDVNDDDAFDAAYFEAEEEGRFEESFLFNEDQSVDPEHLERVRLFKALNMRLAKLSFRNYRNWWMRKGQLMSWSSWRNRSYGMLSARRREKISPEKLVKAGILLGKSSLDLKGNLSTMRNGTFRVSIGLFKFLSLTEIWVIRNKIRRSSNLNELLRDRLMDNAIHNNPQVVRNPYCVKFIHESKFGTFYLDYKHLLNYDVNQMLLVSTIIRTKGFATKAKADADTEILNYCTRKNIQQYFRKMKYINQSQPADFIEDPVDIEFQYHLSLARERKKHGESTAAEEPTQNEPSTPIIHCSDTEEGEVTRSE
ncbi:hypothetical protein ACET3Z_025805 [Daucus carota]